MMARKRSQAIDPAQDFGKVDLSAQENQILKDLESELNFVSQELLWHSDYFGSGQLGAFHYRGEFQGQPAVLKVQGAKPGVSEAVMIQKFAEQNCSKIIRPPNLLAFREWDDKRGYEALILEYVAGPKVLQSGQIQDRDAIGFFFNFYRENSRFYEIL